MEYKKELRYIGEDLFLEIMRGDQQTIINVIDNSERIPIEKFMNNIFLKINAVNNNDYVIVYTVGYSKNVMPYNIEKIYDINERELVDIPNYEIKNIIENMFICEKAVDLDSVVLLINGMIDNEKVIELYKYLTANNPNITIDMVSKYILQKYPKLNKYVGIGKKNYTIEYLKMTKSFDDDLLYLKVMPQKIDDIIKNNLGYAKKLIIEFQ